MGKGEIPKDRKVKDYMLYKHEKKCKNYQKMRRIPNLKVNENKFLKVYKHILTYLKGSKKFYI